MPRAYDQPPKPNPVAVERPQQEEAELTQALELLQDWLRRSDLPQVEKLRQKTTPRLVMFGADSSAIGLKFSEALKQVAAVEQDPHGELISDQKLRDPAAVTEAFTAETDLVVLPFTIDRMNIAEQSSTDRYPKLELIELSRKLVDLPNTDALIIVLNLGEKHKKIFQQLGLTMVVDQPLAHPTNTPEDAGQLSIFVHRETFLTPDNIRLIRDCDFLLKGHMTGLMGYVELLDDDIDAFGILGGSERRFMEHSNHIKALRHQFASRLTTLEQAVPQLLKHPDQRFQELGAVYQHTLNALPSLIATIDHTLLAAERIHQAAEQQILPNETDINLLHTAYGEINNWYTAQSVTAASLMRSPILQAYRLITTEDQRREQ